jgi:hypothetical protein
MFPLGSVLFPHMPMALRLFEPRYLKMLGDLLEDPRPEFGVVLIERGHEVGGGDQRFEIGTMAQVLEVDAQQDFMGLVARGSTRFSVRTWLPEDPYPVADVEPLPPLEWSDSLARLRTETEGAVRKALSLTSEFGDTWPPEVELSQNPIEACWQLAGVTPVGALDQIAMLKAASAEELLTLTAGFARDAAETISMGWPDTPDQ